jgi:hypothetical protein
VLVRSIHPQTQQRPCCCCCVLMSTPAESLYSFPASLRHVRILCRCVLLLFYILYHPTTTPHPTPNPHDRRRYPHLRNTYTPGRKIYAPFKVCICCSDGYSVSVLYIINAVSYRVITKGGAISPIIIIP